MGQRSFPRGKVKGGQRQSLPMANGWLAVRGQGVVVMMSPGGKGQTTGRRSLCPACRCRSTVCGRPGRQHKGAPGLRAGNANTGSTLARRS